MTVVKKYRAVIWKAAWVHSRGPWFVGFVAIPGSPFLVQGLNLYRWTHAEAIQAAHDVLHRLNAGATEDDGGVVDP